MNKASLSSLGIYAVIIIVFILMQFGFIREYSNSAFDIRNILPMTIAWSLIAYFFLVYRKEKVQPKGLVSSANHVAVTATGWCALVFAALGIMGSVLLGAFLLFLTIYHLF